ncbi:hypothetical protein FRC01_005139, partial [Tulasnella sp. 417]
ANIKPKINMAPSVKERSSLNDTLAIHQIPIELLMTIFECFLQPATTALMYYRQLCTLSGVCARWLFIIQHSPKLWTNAAGIIEQEGFLKVLERSSDKLIDVEYDPPFGFGWRYGELHFVDFIGSFASATRRWRTLILGTSYYPGDLPSDFLQFPAPNLERLVFKNDQVWDMEDVELFGGDCPNLKHIHLEGAQFNWSQPAFERLESLKLLGVSFNTVGSILDIIRPLTQLRRLEIHDCDVSEQVPENTQSVSLPNLHFLRAEFANNDESISSTEQFLSRTSAPPECSLYISLINLDEKNSFVATFCGWLFGKQTKEVLEGVEKFNLGFEILEDDPESGPVDFELVSGSANIQGGIRGFGPKDVHYVLEYIQGLFRRSCPSKTFTSLRLSGCGVELLNNNQILTPFKELPPITHLELVDPVWPSQNPSSDEVSNGLGLPTASPFSAIKALILREVYPEDILETVLGVLGDPQGAAHSTPECRAEHLDLVEIHIEEADFTEVEGVVEVLRNDSRIGRVDLYVAL